MSAVVCTARGEGLKIGRPNAEKRTTVVFSSPRSARLACGIAVAAAGLVYLNALDNPFIYDDHVVIGENRSLLAPLNVLGLFLHDLARPVVNVSYALDQALWGGTPFGFHLTNLVLHMLNVGLLFVLVRGVFATAFGERRQDAASTPQDEDVTTSSTAALVAALLLAVHPMMTQAVGYISGRPDVLCTTWLLLGLLAARRWMRGAAPRYLVATGGFWVLALATKETAAMFPLALLFFDRLVVPGDRAERRRRATWMHAPLLGVSVVFVIARLTVLSFVEHAEPVAPEWRFALVELDVVRQYLLLLLTPREQGIFHAVSPVSGLVDPRVILSVLTIAGLLGLAWRVRHVAGVASFGLVWFLLLLVPSSMLVILDRGEPMAEHRVYTAGVGLFMAIGVSTGWLVGRLSLYRPALMRVVQSAVVVWLVVLGGRTVLRNDLWGDPVAVWTEAADRAPDHWVPNLVLGEELQRADRCSEAVTRFQTAIRLYPSAAITYRKLGGCLLQLGRLADARVAFEQLREYEPESVHVTNGLGALALVGGRPAVARGYFLETLDRDPHNVQASEGLAALPDLAATPHGAGLDHSEGAER